MNYLNSMGERQPPHLALRGADKLAALAGIGADDVIDLTAAPDKVDGDLAKEGAEVDVVLDSRGHASRIDDHASADRPQGSEPPDLVDPDRCHCWTKHQTALSCSSPGKH
jgi:hypothetical protein